VKAQGHPDLAHLKDEENERLLAPTRICNWLIILLMRDTGPRIQDLSQAKVSDLDLDTGSIRVSGMKVKLSPMALLEL
jgi:integrase